LDHGEQITCPQDQKGHGVKCPAAGWLELEVFAACSFHESSPVMLFTRIITECYVRKSPAFETSGRSAVLPQVAAVSLRDLYKEKALY